MKFNIITERVISSQGIVLDRECNGWIAINSGLTDANVNGVTLKAGNASASGESIQVSGHEKEKFEGRIDISFPTGTGEVTMIQQIYLP